MKGRSHELENLLMSRLTTSQATSTKGRDEFGTDSNVVVVDILSEPAYLFGVGLLHQLADSSIVSIDRSCRSGGTRFTQCRGQLLCCGKRSLCRTKHQALALEPVDYLGKVSFLLLVRHCPTAWHLFWLPKKCPTLRRDVELELAALRSEQASTSARTG